MYEWCVGAFVFLCVQVFSRIVIDFNLSPVAFRAHVVGKVISIIFHISSFVHVTRSHVQVLKRNCACNRYLLRFALSICFQNVSAFHISFIPLLAKFCLFSFSFHREILPEPLYKLYKRREPKKTRIAYSHLPNVYTKARTHTRTSMILCSLSFTFILMLSRLRTFASCIHKHARSFVHHIYNRTGRAFRALKSRRAKIEGEKEKERADHCTLQLLHNPY